MIATPMMATAATTWAWLVPIAFGPIYVVGVAIVIGMVVIALLGRAPGNTELPAETDTRGKADHPLVKAIDDQVEAKIDFLLRMGFKDIDYVADDSRPEVAIFSATNPMPLSGGGYLVHFLNRKKMGEVVPSPVVLSFISEVKHSEDIMKGILITSAAFSQNAWGVLEKAPVELIDGKHLLALMKMWHPERFPRDRV